MQRVCDFLLFGVVVVFAFLTASFAVRNSDFWMHLASGRLLAEGHSQFGVDPFAYTTTGSYWANHAWLYDVLLFIVYKQCGGTAVVILKAVLIAGLAAVLLSVRRPGSRWGTPALCMLLAVLAMSPRLLLHSRLLSYVLLGLTLWLLWRPGIGATTFRGRLRHYAPLLLLFVLWVNVDGWFLLGPLLAALFWLGDWLAPAGGADETRQRTPLWVWLAGLALLVVNPHHVETSMLPAELMPLPAALDGDVFFQPLHASPWHANLYYHPSAGVNWAGSAYLLLLLLGALSFVLNARRLTGWRLLVWLAFAALSVWRVRTIPFFAVVAGPITALNLQDYLQRRTAANRPEGMSWQLGRIAVLILGLGLIFLAWPGWLQGVQDIGRHVDWTVQPDGSLRRVAETLRDWHGKLGEGRGFLAHPSVVHYCAWFCPEEKGFLDTRLELFHSVAGQYEEVRAAVNPSAAAPKRQGNDWRKLLRDWNITHLVVYDPARQRLFPALRQLAQDESNWTLLHVDGQALIIGWRDGPRLLPESVPLFDADHLAFTAAEESEGERMVPDVPGGGPAREPRSAGFWASFGPPVAPSAWETEAAGVLLQYFRDRISAEEQKRATHCFAWVAALAGSPPLMSGSLEPALRSAVVMNQAPSAPGDPGQQSPALPLLAVRLARCALAKNPDDASAYLVLAQAYTHLRDLTPERSLPGSLWPLAQLRHIQIVAALENAVRLQPDRIAAHEALAAFYERRRFFDAALEHRREAVRLTRRAGALPGESADTFARRLGQMDDDTRSLEVSVSELRNEFALSTQQLGSDPYHKAQLAVNMGLPRLALDEVLSPSHMALLGGDGVRLQMKLSLQMGRISVVRERLDDPDWQINKEKLGGIDLAAPTPDGRPRPVRLPAYYDWLVLCQSAAVGDYDRADVAVQALLTGLFEPQTSQDIPRLRLDAARLLATEMGIWANPPSQMLRLLLRDYWTLWARTMGELSYYQSMQSEAHALAGMLSLERGRPDEAERSFGKSIARSKLISEAEYPGSGRILADSYLRLLWAVRHQVRRQSASRQPENAQFPQPDPDQQRGQDHDVAIEAQGQKQIAVQQGRQRAQRPAGGAGPVQHDSEQAQARHLIETAGGGQRQRSQPPRNPHNQRPGPQPAPAVRRFVTWQEVGLRHRASCSSRS